MNGDIEISPCSVPEFVDEVVYADDQFQVRKIWRWNVNSIYEDEETGILRVRFRDCGGSTFASVDGRRLTDLTFDDLDGFQEGLACVAIDGCGYGYVNQEMEFVIPMKYNRGGGFNKGRARVELNGQSFFIDKTGKELASDERVMQRNYQKVGYFSEGICPVSMLELDYGDLKYFSDNNGVAGIWGFINENGDEIVKPQYIYAYGYNDGIAIVAKGEWIRDPDTGRYCAEKEIWGGIDANGAEVIPFIFDEIKFFGWCTEYYIAHYGGWKDGAWGVIDRSGNWAAEPVFADIGYEYRDGLFAFYGSCSRDKELMGIYDVRRKRTLFEPQFLDVSFLEDGDIEVEVYDEKIGREVEKIIDQNGIERFKSEYSYIYTVKAPYEVMIRSDGSEKRGFIDKDGTVVVPCVYDAVWGGLDLKHRRFIFAENGKQGIKNFDGEIIIPAEYLEIHGKDNPFLTVRVGTKNRYKEGMITASGITVIDAEYERVFWCKDRKHFFGCADGKCEMYLLEEKQGCRNEREK